MTSLALVAITGPSLLADCTQMVGWPLFRETERSLQVMPHFAHTDLLTLEC